MRISRIETMLELVLVNVNANVALRPSDYQIAKESRKSQEFARGVGNLAYFGYLRRLSKKGTT